MKLLSTILTVASGIVCCLLVIILPVSYHFNLWKSDDKSRKLLANDYSIAITPHFRLEFFDGGVLFFSNEIPYLNGIRHMADEKGILYKKGHAHEVRDLYWHIGDYYVLQETLIGEHGEFVEKDRDCDLPGIHYRCFYFADKFPPDWTLMTSLWYPISIFAILPALWIFRRVRLRFKKS